MKNIITLNIILLGMLFSFSQQNKPKLVVGIVVDQMRNEYLHRFYDDFSKDGFKKLMNKGFVYNNMHYNYMPTYTGPGHASIYTGTTPENHGIIANEWFVKGSENDFMYCTQDNKMHILGGNDEKAGKMSPKNMQTTTITDELRLATNFKGKVIGMSIKDRGAILPAGHFANYAFWLTDDMNFVSSSFYGESLPEWLTNFNEEKKYLSYIEQGWNLLKPKDNYTESLPDKNPYEGQIGGMPPTFPYNLKKEFKKNGPSFLKQTPYGNTLLTELALACLSHEKLGEDEITDFLAISYSSTDYIGHVMGPRSMEIQDTYMRLDLEIASIIKTLDAKVGKGNYILFLTSDHACGENPNHLNDLKYKVTNLDRKEVAKSIKDISTNTFGENFISNYSNQNIFLNTKKLEKANINIEEFQASLAKEIEKLPFVKRAYTQEQILHPANSDYFLNTIANGYDNKQNGELVLLFKPAYMQYGYTGTTHGTPYGYDTHVPAIFYGWNIPKGVSAKKVSITEIAPSISQLLNITLPNGSESEVLEELFVK